MNESVLEVNHFPLSHNISIEDFKNVQREKVFLEIIAYCILFSIGAIGNILALSGLLKRRQLSQFINYLMAHLTFADLIVVFISMPIEIIWRVTISWEAGNIACKFLQVVRLFGLYLSSLVVVCISIDRLNAFSECFKSSYRKFNRLLLASAWILSLLLSLPQAFLFKVEYHELLPGYAQCIQSQYFVHTWKEKLYHLVCLTGMYFGPLLTIVFCYSKILWSLHLNGQQLQLQDNPQGRHSNGNPTRDSKDVRRVIARYQYHRYSVIQRAKRRTLKMTLIIVIAYILCWSPYAFFVIWYSFDYESAQHIDPSIQEGVFIFAVANSCVNPFVYRMNLVRRFPSNLK